MKTSSKLVMLVVAFTLNLDFSLLASEITHEFKNPAFSGNGYSQHVLSINQLEVQREQGVIDDLKSAKAAAERAEKNKTVNKFIANVFNIPQLFGIITTFKITLILLFISITFISCMGDVKPNISVENDINLTIDGENIDGVQGEWIITSEEKKEKGKDMVIITIKKNDLD